MTTYERNEAVEVYSNGILIRIEDNRDLGNAINAVIDDIIVYRDLTIANGIWFMGQYWSTNQRAQLNLISALTANTAGIPLPPNFTIHDDSNTGLIMNSLTLLNFANSMFQYVDGIYLHSWAVRDNVALCNSLADLDNAVITIYTGWPDNDMDGSRPL